MGWMKINTLMLLSLMDDNLELFDILLNHGADLNLQYQMV